MLFLPSDASLWDATGGVQALFLPGDASRRDATLPGLFCGFVTGRNAVTKQSGAARSVPVPTSAM
jgi:hypothetical protein